MLLGLGYLPQGAGPALWRRFDAGEIEDDLAQIAQLGFQAVRAPLFWADFQPGEKRIDASALDHFGMLLDLAHGQGLRVTAGLWAGMWDGALWWPDWGVLPAPLPPHWPLIVNDRWVRGGRVRHPFTDERMLAARTVLIRELVAFFAGHPALLGWEPLPGFGRLAAAVDTDVVRDWLGSATQALSEAAPASSSTYLLALDALETKGGIWPDDVITAGGKPSLSVAAFASDRRRQPLDARWIAFALDLAAGLAGQPISLHLAGLPTVGPGEPSSALDGVHYANEEAATAYLADVIAIAQAWACPELWLWRWADIPEDHWQFPPYDQPTWRRRTGLLRSDGQPKKLTEALHTATGRQMPVLAFDPAAYRADPAAHFLPLWQQYQQTSFDP